MTREILLTLGVTAGALALFVWNRLRLDVVGLLVLAAVMLLGLVPPERALSGFANEATITVALMLVLSTGLLRTGAIDLLGRWMGRLAGQSEFRLLLVMLAAVGLLYLTTVGRWLTPVRETATALLDSYELREYLAAVRVRPDSDLVGRSLGEERFEETRGLHVLEIHRGDERIRFPSGRTVLRALDLLPIVLSALLGVIAMFLTGAITPSEAYDGMDWMVVILLGSILSLGVAMQETGTGAYIAQKVVDLTRPAGLYGTLAAFYAMTSVLTELISNNAAAVVLTPVAIAAAEAMGISPMPFLLAVMFAASNSFMTPVGYQTNTFVYGPGGYRFSDFLRVGGPLNLLLLAVATFVIPLFFPFKARSTRIAGAPEACRPRATTGACRCS